GQVSCPGSGEPGPGLTPRWRGRGPATRAVRLACRFAAGAGATPSAITVDPASTPSAVVTLWAGFRRTAPDYARFDRYVRDLRISRTMRLTPPAPWRSGNFGMPEFQGLSPLVPHDYDRASIVTMAIFVMDAPDGEGVSPRG